MPPIWQEKTLVKTLLSSLFKSFDSCKSNQRTAIKQLDRVEPIEEATSFIIRGPSPPGKFDAVVAKSLGVPPGPLCKDLVNGKSVTLDNGTIIRPEQVVKPAKPGAVFIIIDCPSIRYIPSLIENEEWDNYTTSKIEFIVHNIGPGVLTEASYQKWIQTFQSTKVFQFKYSCYYSTLLFRLIMHQIQSVFNLLL